MQKSTIKHLMEMNKTLQDTKMNIEPIKKTQTEEILEMETQEREQEQQTYEA